MNITKITIGRLYNLGSYEHIRYEVTVEIPEGADVSKTLIHLETALNTLAVRPPEVWSVRHARESLSKPVSEQTEHDLSNAAAHREIVRRAEEWKMKQDYARKMLGDFALSSEFTDHKDNWDQEDAA